MKTQNVWITSLKAIVLFTLLLGIVYPFFIWVIGQSIFPSKSNGSLITRNNKVIGSALIAQRFESEKYFTPRPSAINYNPFPSGGSNLSITDFRLKTAFEERYNDFKRTNNISQEHIIPAEMLFASGSGVDPHISKISALLQINRIALKRNLDEITIVKLKRLVNSLSHRTIWGIAGDEYVNVLEMNLKLDELAK